MSRVLIDRLRSGRYRVRVEEPDGSLPSLGTFARREEAVQVREHMRALLAVKRPRKKKGTLRAFGTQWLARRKGRRSYRQDDSRWRNHIEAAPFIDWELHAIRRPDIKRWRDSLVVADKTARECFLMLRAILADAVEEDLVKLNPAAGLKVPKPSKARAAGWLYVEEDAQLLGCTKVPLGYRVLYGFLAREGMRKSEALNLTWEEFDLDRGIVRLDENKSDDPRMWKLSEGVHRALVWWREYCRRWEKRRRGDDHRVFVGVHGHGLQTLRAVVLREHLELAGIRRRELFEQTSSRMRMRVHDIRATFVTLHLAAGMSETWVTDRTGHRSHSMVQRYKRASRTAAELGQGLPLPLDKAIPECAAAMIHARIRGRKKLKRGAELRRAQTELKTHGRKASRFDPGRGYQGVPLQVFDGGSDDGANVVDHFVDHLRALHAALCDDDAALARSIAHDIATDAGPLIDEANEKRRRILADDPHSIRLAVDLLDLLLPDVDELHERRNGTEGGRG